MRGFGGRGEEDKVAGRQVTVIATFHAGRVLAYLAVVVAFTMAIVLAQVANRHAQATARQATAAAREADATSAALTVEVKRVLAFRADQLGRIHAQDIRSCRSRHKLYVAIRALGERARRRALLAGDTAGVNDLDVFLVRLRAADCTGVPKLLPPAKG